MKFISLYYKFFGVILLSLLISSAYGQYHQNEIELKQTDKTCGLLCLENVYEWIFPQDFPDTISYSPINFLSIIKTAQKLGLHADPAIVTIEGLESLKTPIMLHYKNDHFVVFYGVAETGYKIFDPISGYKIVSKEFLANKWSGNVLIFVKGADLQSLSANASKNIYGFWDGTTTQGSPQGNNINGQQPYGDKTNSNRTGACSINGAPLFSITPINLNITAEDIPLWYNSGIGPEIQIRLTYNAQEKNQSIGSGNSNTNFYPLGKMWTLNYASFYSIDQASNVTHVGSDGRNDFYENTNNPQIPFIMPLGKMLEIFQRSTGFSFTNKDSKTSYNYNSPFHSKITSIKDKNGNSVLFTYNSTTNNLQSITDAKGRVTQVLNDANGRITQIQDPFGRSVLFEYSGEYLTKITDMAGYVSNLIYDEVPVFNGNFTATEVRLISIETPNGITSINYEIVNTTGIGVEYNRITITNPDGNTHIYSWTPESTSFGTTRFIDYNGNVTNYQIDITNQRINKIIPSNPESTVFYGYHENGIKNSILIGSRETQYEFDENRNLTQITNPRGKSTLMDYDGDNNLIEITDPLSRITSFGYDENDNLTSITTPVSSISYSYFDNGNLKEITDPRGFHTSFFYDGNGHLNNINYPQGNPTTITNDELGRPATVTTDGVALNYSYDSLDHISKINFPDGTSTDYEYFFQRMTNLTDRGGRMVEYFYDNMSSLIRTNGPQGEVLYNLDGNGNILSLIINGVTTSYIYDEMDRVIKIINPNGTFRQFTYDELGNLITRQDESGTSTTYTYDFDLIIQIDYGDNTPDVEYTYNNNGEVASMTDVIGTTAYNYDNGGRLIYIDRPGNDGDMNYTYNAAGNRLSMSIPNMAVSYDYDDLNRLTKVSSDFASAEYQYNDNNNLVKKSLGNGSYTDYAYDGLNRLLSLQNKKSTGEIFSGFEYTYDEASMIKTILDNNNNLFSYNYDYANQLSEEKVEDAGGNILWHDQFAYDNMGNRLTQDKNGTIDFYENNLNNQLVSLKKQSNNVKVLIYGDTAVKLYVNNILADLTKSGDTLLEFLVRDIPLRFSADTGFFVASANGILAMLDDSSRFVVHTKKYPNNEIYLVVTDDTTGIPTEYVNLITRNYETIQYNYDPKGNLVERITPFDTTTYTYDAESRLTKVELPGNYFEEYEYDGLSQRTKVHLGGFLHETFVYDNLFEVIKTSNIDDNIFITRGLNFGGGIGGIISEYETLNAYCYNNHRGDIINFMDDIDTSLNTNYIIYKAFGERYNNGETNYFNSKELENNTGFIYYGYRYYVPELGRWISQDPLRYSDGINYYSFVGNDPINWLDLWGLFRFGKRPLEKLRWIQPQYNPIADWTNTELSHEHGFYEDKSGDNIGFGKDGPFSENPEGKGYRYGDKKYDDDIMREAQERVENGDYSVLGSRRKNKNNCQDWADRLRKVYHKIVKEREKNTGNGCK